MYNHSLPVYPQEAGAVYGLTGGLLTLTNSTNSTILLCGGSDHQDNVSDRCFALTDLQHWEQFPSLKLYFYSKSFKSSTFSQESILCHWYSD